MSAIATSGVRSTSQKIGWLVFGIGALYMLGLGWFYSWWMVPAANQSGAVVMAGVVGFIWGLSVPLGAFIVAIGAALSARAGGRTLGLMVLAFLFAFWQTSWVIPQVVPALFGTGGGLITLFFLASAWQWASIRPALSGSAKTGADLSILGLVFFVVAAWNLCGVFGIGNYVLRPELADKFSVPLGSTINMASRVLVLFVVGWGFTFFGQWKTREAHAIEQSPAGSYPAVGDRLVDPVKP